MVLFGATAAAVSVTWWTYQGHAVVKAREAADRDTTRHDAALAEVQSLEQRFEQAMLVGTVGPPLVKEVEDAIVNHPKFPQPHRLMGQWMASLGRRERAYDEWTKSLEIDPHQPELCLLTGTAAFELGRYDAAVAHYRTALSLEPDNPRYALHLAGALIQVGQYDEARAILERSLAADSSRHAAHAMLCDLYKKQGQTTLAMEQIDKAITLLVDSTTPADLTARRNYTLIKAELLRIEHQPDQALLLLSGLSAADRGRLDVLESAAKSWQQAGKPEEAAKMYEQAFAAQPLKWELPAEAARYWLKAGNKTQARKMLDAVRALNPRADVLNELANPLRD